MSAPLRVLGDAALFDWLRLARSDNVGPRTFRVLIERYGTATQAIAALPSLARRGGARPIGLAPAEAVEREAEAVRRAGLLMLPSCDPAYPAALRAIDTPPPLLLLRGRPAILQRPAVAIVGSRNASAGMLVFTERLARALSEAGYAVVSGLARGIDARAHQASLAGGTVAVLAGGHERIYPGEHVPLADMIAATGAVLSEMPLTWEPRGRDFPRRNRIVSGLALGVVVVEAAQRSGSLITARFAAEQGRMVFAVPGSPFDPRSEGTNALLRGGAILCASPDHVLEDLAPLVGAPPPSSSGSLRDQPDEDQDRFWPESDLIEEEAPGSGRSARPDVAGPAPWPVDDRPEGSPKAEPRDVVLDLVGIAPVAVDDLVRVSGLPVGSVQAALVDLECEGRLIRHGTATVSRRLP